MLSEKIIDCVEEMEMNIIVLKDNEYQIEFWSDAGEDVAFYINAANDQEFCDEFWNYAADFDPDEHAELYVNMRGERGVPETIKELIDDADSIKETLENTAKALCKLK